MLTGLPNRRYAMDRFLELWEEAIRQDMPIACMMIDADHFKKVNDTYGHDAGDKVLVELAKKLLDVFRKDDVVCRLGVDEFLIICPNTNLKSIVAIAQRILRSINQFAVPVGNSFWYGSLSIGVVARLADMDNFEALIKMADQSLYLAKQSGRNCVKTIFDQRKTRSQEVKTRGVLPNSNGQQS